MVIDDDPTELEVLRAAFPPDSFDMLEMRDADSGFQVLESVRPDLVILDWKLPGDGGAETLAELKLRNPDLPVIVLADHGDPKQRQIAALLDADEFLTRPFDAVELLGKAELLDCSAESPGAVTASAGRQLEPERGAGVLFALEANLALVRGDDLA